MELGDGHRSAQTMTVSINGAWRRLCQMVGREELELGVKLEQRVFTVGAHIMTIFKVELYCISK